ncbi:hypothetical protein [Chitinophaga solisilvae]|uniref:hypothetical protein n=1 Tax=Chitinophaga solisilvae TaxID=1233460 RepID=UPI00136D873C|nr:hypothetical protein [Chitinophaga solisilvae]
MKSIFRSCLMLAVAGLLFSGCKKGDTGPEGPAGAANVIYTSWVPTSIWVASTTSAGAGKKTYYFDIAAAKVTQEIVDKGTVLVYMKFVSDPDGDGIAKLLPSIYYNIGGAGTQYRFQYGLFPGKVRIIADVLPAGIPSESNMVRYLIIPGGVPNARVAGRDYTKMTYEEVCRLYNIPL